MSHSMLNPIKKLSLIVPMMMSLTLSAQANTPGEYERYEAAIEKASNAAEATLKTGNPTKIANAYYRVAKLRSEARSKNHVCDIGYLSSIVENMQTVVDHSPWFQQNLSTLPIYAAHKAESLQLQLMSVGLVKGKTFTNAQFKLALEVILASSTFELYKPVPGVFPLGSITFYNNGTATDHSVILTEEGEVQTIDTPNIAVRVGVLNDKVTIFFNGRPAYALQVIRGETEVQDSIRSDDQLKFQAIDENGIIIDDYINQLFFSPDECSA